MERTIVLIGPAGVGKSTVGAALAAELDVPFVDLDAVASPYYDDVGQPVVALIERVERDGLAAAHRWWQPARARAAAGVVADHPGAVIAFGAGHAHYEDDEWAEAVCEALAGAHVVLLLPDPDAAVSERFLVEHRAAAKATDWAGVGFLAEWVRSEQHRRLATITCIVGERTPEQAAAAIAATLGA